MVIDPHQTRFQGKHDAEEFQFYFRQHWIRLLPSFTRTVFINVFVFGVGYMALMSSDWGNQFARQLTLLSLASVFLVFNLEFLIRFYRYFLYVIVVTDKKLHRIKKTLLMTDDHQTIDLWSLQDITKSQHGVVQNIFGYGTISLEAQETVLRLHFIPNIAEKYVHLMSLQDRARSHLNTSRYTRKLMYERENQTTA
jgi:hypothetical protein